MNDKMFLVMNKRERLADWVRKERSARNWSQSELADRMGKVRAVINKIESASNDPTLDTLAALAKAFGYRFRTVLVVLGYEEETEGVDTWIEDQKHKLSRISPARRELAEKVISSFAEAEDAERTPYKDPKTSPVK